MLLEQAMNYLAIELLDKAGFHAPSQQEIDRVESQLNQWLAGISMKVANRAHKMAAGSSSQVV